MRFKFFSKPNAVAQKNEEIVRSEVTSTPLAYKAMTQAEIDIFKGMGRTSDYETLYRASPTLRTVIDRTVTAVSGFPLALYAGDQRIESHPILKLFDNPNRSRETFGDIRRAFWLSYLVEGAGYIYIPKSGITGGYIGMWNLPFYNVTPRVNPELLRTEFQCTESDLNHFARPKLTVTDDEMLWMTTVNLNSDIIGTSIVESVRYQAEMEPIIAKWNTQNAQKGINLPGVFTYPSIPDEAIRKQLFLDFQEKLRSNPGQPLVLFGGVSYQSFGSVLKDSDYVNGLAVGMKAICAAFGFPYRFIDPSSSSLNTTEMQAIIDSWYTGQLLSLAQQEAETYTKFFFPNGGDMKFAPYLPGVPQYMAALFRQGSMFANNPYFTANEARKFMNLPPVPDMNADKLITNATTLLQDLGFAEIPAGEADEETL